MFVTFIIMLLFFQIQNENLITFSINLDPGEINRKIQGAI